MTSQICWSRANEELLFILRQGLVAFIHVPILRLHLHISVFVLLWGCWARLLQSLIHLLLVPSLLWGIDAACTWCMRQHYVIVIGCAGVQSGQIIVHIANLKKIVLYSILNRIWLLTYNWGHYVEIAILAHFEQIIKLVMIIGCLCKVISRISNKAWVFCVPNIWWRLLITLVVTECQWHLMHVHGSI